MDIQIEKFKKINDVKVSLVSLNIFIGANNSGKSSFIQGVQFAISACQTLNLKGGTWLKGAKTLSLDSTEYLYTPTKHIEYLYHGKRLTGSRTKEARDWMKFTLTDGKSSNLRISRGKNGGFTTSLTGKELGEILSSIENPYCVYVPGIAGIPTQEKYEVAITVKKSATRGDSNNYLRNILYAISQDQVRWVSFKDSVNSIYANIGITADFDEHKSEFIHVYVTVDGIELPLDSVGTGLLQVIQIFAYIEYFSPRIILLDEPDSHIHPTKQKLLANELARRAAANPDLRVVFSTHSRYILDALEAEANVVHFQNGNAFQGVKGSNILLDIGAADADYLFAKKSLKYVVVTEDKVDEVESKKEFLKKFLLANGLKEDEFVLHSYEGCTKVEFARILQGFVRKQIPTAKVVLHIDRDQKVDDDREVLKLKEDCQNKDIAFFMTHYQEIESYFCTPQHISFIYGVSLKVANEKYQTFIKDLEGETKRKLSNFILRDRPEISRNKDGKQDIQIINNRVNEWYVQFGEQLTPGKELLAKIKNYAQTELRSDPNKITEISAALISKDFKELLEV